ncbi:MAG: ACP S-malonyltransferase [Trichodesmium sp. St15_bin1_1]|jgi:predicted nuclease of predicted toxin-antitoxin system|nr:ACP S-malonyltransferase [Trichodesmium sp. St18_bin1]MDE5087745.1 ACP S-malonyltransferase [Trichodesmium sp. St16_bin2-tuft]MDE5107475.1 ACP S-malonyltransferase [Trichodesmium sp. St17_bin3_1_1]MDE5115294.1 ACP S-malonyltransferase [Trichodesmium sp. St15_bin1_1]MDE5124120.1 ACP S-malonyltransferase [Trichodesmium sp. St19_bin1]
MNFLIDYNLNGPALILLGSLTGSGWLDLIDIRFIRFSEVELPMNSSDRQVWRFAQANQMILLTANRSMKGKDSLEQVIREENTPTSFPVLTIANVDRLLADSNYRERCVNRLIEIAIDIEYYKGTMRIFIP